MIKPGNTTSEFGATKWYSLIAAIIVGLVATWNTLNPDRQLSADTINSIIGLIIGGGFVTGAYSISRGTAKAGALIEPGLSVLSQPVPDPKLIQAKSDLRNAAARVELLGGNAEETLKPK